MRGIVEDHEGVRNHKEDVGNIQSVFVTPWQLFKETDDVVSHEPHGAAIKPGKRGVRDRLVRGQNAFDRLKGIWAEGVRRDLVFSDNLDLAVEAFDHDGRAAAEQRVPAPLFPALHAFKKERMPVVVDLRERGHRGLHVRKYLSIYRDQVPLFRLFFELFERGLEHKTPEKISGYRLLYQIGKRSVNEKED